MYRLIDRIPQNRAHETFVTWENGFTTEELSQIEKYCDKNVLTHLGSVGHAGNQVDQILKIRNSQVGVIEMNDETMWLYDRIAYITRRLNSEFYDFNLEGMFEGLQYTVYKGSENGRYDWHIDMGTNCTGSRKLSLSLLVSDPKSYDGGDLEFLEGNDPMVAPRVQGLVTAFPAYRLHRVTPVTRGVRKSIVVWVSGPPFR